MPEEPPNPPTPEPKKEPDEGRTFNQADVDRIVAERLAREKGKHADYDDLKAKADKLDELEAANKSETDRLKEQVGKLTNDLASANGRAERLQIALDKGLTPAQTKRLAGTTKEELEADADELLETFQAKPANGPPPSGKPKPDLQGGGDPTSEPVDVKALVDSIPPTA